MGERRGRRVRIARAGAALALAVALVGGLAVLAVLAASVLLVGDAGWRTAWAEVAAPAPQAALPDGPVMVLGGSSTRLDLALSLPGVPGPSRPLVLSAGAINDWERQGGTCDDPHVVCVDPEPGSTYGEALALDVLAAERGWEAVTVVTSDFHVARTRWQLAACAAVPTVVVAPGAGPTVTDQPRQERLKLVNAGLRTGCRWWSR